MNFRYCNNTMMGTSNFQEGHGSPAKNSSGRVYASVAEMKRSKGKVIIFIIFK